TRSSEGRAHRGVRVQVPPWSLLVTALSCGSKHRPSEGWLASSTLAWGTGGCLADFEHWVYEARWVGSTLARPTGSEGRSPGTRMPRAIATRHAPFPVAPVRGVCGEDQRQARLPVHQGTGRCDPARDG